MSTQQLHPGQLFGLDASGRPFVEQELPFDATGPVSEIADRAPLSEIADRGRRDGFSCTRCGEWFFADAADKVGQQVREMGCPVCSGTLEWRGTVGPDGTVTYTATGAPCDDQCTSARGVACECRCGGRNHGTRRLVTVTWVEGRATLSLSDSRLTALSARRLPEIEAAEQLAAELVERLEQAYADVLADRRNGVWMERSRWERAEEWGRLRREVNRVMRLKTPAGRIKGLRAVESALQSER